MLFDLHVHTNISPCSNLSVQDIIKNAQARGIDGVCITDHDSMEINNYCREGVQENGLCLIFGMEYTTSEGDFLIFGPFDHIPLGLSAKEMLFFVHQTGGIAIVAHPFRVTRPAKVELLEEGFCSLVEAINGRNTLSENCKALEYYSHKRNVSILGGSDAHSLDELGKVPINIYGEIKTRADFIHALNTGEFTLSFSAC